MLDRQKNYYPPDVNLTAVAMDAAKRFKKTCWDKDSENFGEIKDEWSTSKLSDTFALFPDSTCTGLVVRVSDGKFRPARSQACHGFMWMDIGNLYADDDPRLLVTMRQCDHRQGPKGDKDKEIAFRYFDWLLNDSPWAHCYIITDPQFAWDYGVAHRFDRDHRVLMMSCIAFRHSWEKFGWIKGTWFPLVEAGMHPTLAFALGQSIVSQGETWSATGGFMQHMAIGPYYHTKRSYERMLEGTSPEVKSEHDLYFVKKGYGEINRYWGQHDDRYRRDNEPYNIKLLRQFRAENKADEEKKAVNLNIFEVFRNRRRDAGEGGLDPDLTLSKKELRPYAEFVNREFGV